MFLHSIRSKQYKGAAEGSLRRGPQAKGSRRRTAGRKGAESVRQGGRECERKGAVGVREAGRQQA